MFAVNVDPGNTIAVSAEELPVLVNSKFDEVWFFSDACCVHTTSRHWHFSRTGLLFTYVEYVSVGQLLPKSDRLRPEIVMNRR